MRRAILFPVALCITLILIALPSYGQDRQEDLAGIYRNYFKLIIDRDYAGAWDGLADESKAMIAGLIAQQSQRSPEAILDMLDKNEKSLRDTYFNAFRENSGPLLPELYDKGIFTLKSVRGDEALVTIEIQKDPKDFRMLRKNGKWKVNFFKDLEPVDRTP
jgi:hypothetical protein